MTHEKSPKHRASEPGEISWPGAILAILGMSLLVFFAMGSDESEPEEERNAIEQEKETP